MMEESSKEKVVPEGIQVNSALAYGYIDKMCGFSYKVLGLTYYEDGDYTLIWPNDEVGLTVRGECFKTFELIPIENKALCKRYAREIEMVNSIYSDENDEVLRSMICLDPFRHHDCPDDVLALLFVQGHQPEQIWVRPMKFLEKIEGSNVFTAKMLNAPFDSDYGIHKGGNVILLVRELNGKNIALCHPAK